MLDLIQQRIPIVTIGGFLGAGKTTLINHLLKNADGQRIVVFVNDFGAINIDYQLIETANANRISLKNGCVCCTLNDDLISGLKAFLDENEKPDGFVIEASGIADPRALDRSIALLEKTGSVRFDNRVYVMDADQYGKLDFEDAETIIDHAAAADLIIVNKMDLASASELDRITTLLSRSAPNSSVLTTSNGECSVEMMMGHVQSGLSSSDCKVTFETTSSHHGFVSWSRETRRALDRSKFEKFARSLASVSYRAKGQVFFKDKCGRANVFHMVGNRASLEAIDRSGLEPISRIVAIGKTGHLEQQHLDAWFEELVS